MSAFTRNTNPVLLKLRDSALGRDDRLLPGFSRKLGPVCLTHIGRLLSRGQFGAGLLGVGFQQLIDFFAAIHGIGLGKRWKWIVQIHAEGLSVPRHR